ncbi:hypothetical protein DESC_370087 [Desulfosarcina cetonica]|nr:hypothetical protein DESC_370087 [Desulfosarcina cetonica]
MNLKQGLLALPCKAAHWDGSYLNANEQAEGAGGVSPLSESGPRRYRRLRNR